MGAVKNIVHEQIILLFAGIDDATSIGGKEGLMTWEQVFTTSAIGIHDPDAGALTPTSGGMRNTICLPSGDQEGILPRPRSIGGRRRRGL